MVFKRHFQQYFSYIVAEGHRSRDRMVVGFITTYAISTHHY
jgi:predicted phosphatase